MATMIIRRPFLFVLLLSSFWFTACGVTPPDCSPLTCPTGCCDIRGFCQPGTNQDVCGHGGNFCDVCVAPQTCGGQTCSVPLPNAVDAGQPFDAGTVTVDAGPGRDAGATVNDAGTPADAGAPLDAGTPVDSGTALDAGPSCGCDADRACTGTCSCDPDCSKTVDCQLGEFDLRDAGTPGPLNAVALAADGGWVGGNKQALVRWSPQGWQAQVGPNGSQTYWVSAIRLTDENNGWAVGGWSVSVGGSTYLYGVGLSLVDGHWSLTQNSLGWALNAVDLVDAQNGWAVGHDGQLTQIKGGSYLPLFGSPCSSASLLAVALADENHGWAAGTSGTLCAWNGTAWKKTTTSPTFATIHGLALHDADNGWAVGSYGTVLKLTAGSWSAVAPVTNQTLTSVSLAPDGTVWAVGEANTVLRNTGAGWEHCATDLSATAPWWNAVSSSAAGTLAVGASGERRWLHR